MKRLAILIIIAGIALVAMSAFQYFLRPGSGDIAPQFVLKTIDGDEISSEALEGKPLIVHFWATWCVFCRDEFPSLTRLARDKKADGLVVLGISEDGEGGEKAVRTFLKGLDPSFPILMDEDGSVADAFGSFGMPDSILVSPGGFIARRLEGTFDWDSKEARGLVDALIREKGGSLDEGDKGTER